MANEVLPSSVGDLSLAALLAPEVLMLAANKEDVILSHPAFMRVAGIPGSNVVKVSHVGLMGYDLLASTTAGSEISNTALTDGSSSITLARRAKRYNMDDLAKYMVAGTVSPELLAQDALVSIVQTMVSLAATAGSGFSNSVATSGVNLTWSTFLGAKAKLLVNNATGQAMAILHPVQWADLEADALANGISSDAAILAGAVTAGLGAYKGRWFGVDIFTSQHVPTANAGADRAGCMFVRGGLVVGYAAPEVDSANGNAVALGDFGAFEKVRQGEYGATSYITHSFIGAAVSVENFGCSIVTDA